MSGKEPNGFTALRTVKVCTQHLLAPPAKVFPLLCPTREYEWIEPWKCQMIYSESGCAEQDCIFTTDFHNEGKDVWVVSVYRPNEEIQFVRFNGLRTIRYCITLADNGDGTTTAEWKQVITGLNEEGKRLVEGLTDEAYHQRILGLERRLNHYLTTGKMLTGVRRRLQLLFRSLARLDTILALSVTPDSRSEIMSRLLALLFVLGSCCPIFAGESLLPATSARYTAKIKFVKVDGGKQIMALSTEVTGAKGTPLKTAVGGKNGLTLKLEMQDLPNSEPTQYLAQFRLAEIGVDAKEKSVLAAPKLATIVGTPARIMVGEPKGDRIEVELMVSESGAAPPSTVIMGGVTPRIIIQDEEEDNLVVTPSP